MTGTDRVARALFALLVLACFAAFFVTQRLKHTPTVLQMFKLTPRFSPTPHGHIKAERISFKLAQADAVTVVILDASGNEVATLVRDYPVRRYKLFSLRWNGRLGVARGYTLVSSNGHPSVQAENDGPRAPAGDYRVRVSLRAHHRVLDSPRSFTLVTP